MLNIHVHAGGKSGLFSTKNFEEGVIFLYMALLVI